MIKISSFKKKIKDVIFIHKQTNRSVDLMIRVTFVLTFIFKKTSGPNVCQLESLITLATHFQTSIHE